MLPRRHRLTSPADYRAVLRGQARRRRRRAGTDLLVVHVSVPDAEASAPAEPTSLPTRPPRVGFVVSKAVGNSVVRHRVLRRLRALVAQRLTLLPAGTDVVVRALAAAATASSAELGTALDEALERALPPVGVSR
ncbi:ribonuclease P protein component [Ornithinimicrobium avium]|uniref:Ribonuclease P protein component n=1 Tax=Ornithinimicrobium avium TaxID=2283195 RepID=A0A345NP17_9MICO|nr:ribonuclease P protein component [Ornithinimicrobium avium]AXH96775.1 ribonuclease P protein component [Ornithinimicrobium avium]